MNTTTIPRSAVTAALGRIGIEANEHTVREDYSGRQMFGEECFGVVVPHGMEATITVLLAEEANTPALRKNACADDLGLQRIAYYPGFTVGE